MRRRRVTIEWLEYPRETTGPCRREAFTVIGKKSYNDYQYMKDILDTRPMRVVLGNPVGDDERRAKVEKRYGKVDRLVLIDRLPGRVRGFRG